MSSRLRTVRIAVVIAAALAALMIAPGAASANVVDDVLKGVNDTLKGLLGGQEAPSGAAPAGSANAEPTPNAGSPPNYTPPAHGSDQHGQGTAATVDLGPSEDLPVPYEPGGGDEEVVVGGSRGSVEGGDYHGHVTILTLLGTELIQGADTAEGETSTGPAGDLNALLADICAGSGICLSVLEVSSETGEKNSTNSFSLAEATVAPAGTPAVDLGAVSSEGTISQAGGCRTATGTSRVADLNLLGITANAVDSASESRACNDGSSSQTNTSSVIGLAEAGLPVPAPGCENGTPDSSLNLVVAALVCNADDASGAGGTQLLAPFGVREGLTAFVLGTVAKVTTAASESHALAPGKPGGGGDDDDRDGDGVPDDRDECPGQPGPAANDGCPRDDDGGDDDRDGDGVPDSEDECPNTPGPESNDGCPIDTDGDGLIDTKDECPTVPGPIENDGCPFGLDTDGDGIPDADDACPTVPGPASNDGCPLGGPSGEGPDDLAFTGADVATLALIGFAVGGSGLALMALADRRRRRV